MRRTPVPALGSDAPTGSTATPSAERVARGMRRARPWVYGVALLVAVVLVWVRLHTPSELPHYGAVPAFSLVDQRGHPFAPTDLAGSAWVVDFIFLSCTTSCPTLTSRMSRLQGYLEAQEKRRGEPLPVRLLSISVDPERDTPPRLAEYADTWHANPNRWWFATGPSEHIQKVVADGFRITLARVDKGQGDFDILHGNRFVLVDARGEIRGYYDTDITEETRALERDVLRVADETSR